MSYFYKRANKKYIPVWMYIIQALFSIHNGVMSLITIPFGYVSGFTGLWSEYMLRHSMEIRKKEKNGLTKL